MNNSIVRRLWIYLRGAIALTAALVSIANIAHAAGATAVPGGVYAWPVPENSRNVRFNGHPVLIAGALPSSAYRFSKVSAMPL